MARRDGRQVHRAAPMRSNPREAPRSTTRADGRKTRSRWWGTTACSAACLDSTGTGPSYTGPGVAVTRTSPTLSQLSGRRITDIEISDAGKRQPVDERRNRGHHGDIRRDGRVCQSQQSTTLSLDTGLVPGKFHSSSSRKVQYPRRKVRRAALDSASLVFRVHDHQRPAHEPAPRAQFGPRRESYPQR